MLNEALFGTWGTPKMARPFVDLYVTDELK
jgi:hypothetical protein